MVTGPIGFEDGAMTTEQHSVPRRLRRRSDERVLAGVASGLGDYFNVDPLLIRIALVASIVFGGLGIFLYAAAWLLVPDEASDRSIAERLLGGAGLAGGLVGGVLVLIGALVLINILSEIGGGSDGVGAAAFALIVIAAGAVLLRRRSSDEAVGAGVTSPAEGGEATATTVVRRPRRPPSPLGWYVIGAAMVGIGLLALADTAWNVAVAPTHYVGLALGVIGAGLVIGAWWGHARMLIAIGVLLLPLAWAASLIDVPFEGGWGSQQYGPASADEVQPEYRLAGGQLILDLTRVEAAGQEPIEVSASVAMGDLHVLVPDDASVEVDASVGAGMMRILGVLESGTRLEDRQEVAGDGPSFVLDLGTGLGDLRVDARGTEGR